MKHLLLGASLFISLAACKKNDEGGATNEYQPGFLKGTVKDTKGQPMKGITVLADNTRYYNSYHAGVTDASGNYKISLTNGTYAAYADFDKEYNGKTYKIRLHPDNADPFSQEGGVVNFRWKLTGKIPGRNGLYSGGTVTVDSYPGSAIADPENISFTLKPQGALIDGSAGSVITVKPGQPRTEGYGKLLDIPIGKYKLSAVYNGQPLQLRNGNASGAFATEITIEFEPSTIYGDNMAFVDYKE